MRRRVNPDRSPALGYVQLILDCDDKVIAAVDDIFAGSRRYPCPKHGDQLWKLFEPAVFGYRFVCRGNRCKLSRAFGAAKFTRDIVASSHALRYGHPVDLYNADEFENRIQERSQTLPIDIPF